MSAFDAIVVGAGAAGCAAALGAASRGARVLLLEKDPSAKSNTALSGGWIVAAPTRFQQAAGFDDTAEEFAKDIVRRTGTHTDPELILTLCELSGEVVHWVHDVVGYPVGLYSSRPTVDGAPPRSHIGPRRGDGQGLLDALRAAAARTDRVQVRYEPATELLVEDGRVRGVVAGTERLEASAVVLACGGFAANPELVAEHIPEAARWGYAGGPGATGEALVWARQVGAATEHLDAFFAHSQTVKRTGLRLPDLPADGSIIVDATGRRFAREDMNHSPFALEIERVGGEAVEIFDERIATILARHPLLLAAQKAGECVRADGVEELANKLGLEPERLAATIAEYNQACSTHRDFLGRRRFGEPLSPPFYGARLAPTLVQSQGGLSVSARMEVLREDGSAISGLYAAGNAAVGLCAAGAEYYSGSGLLGALAGGLIAGRALASRDGRR